MSEYFYQFGKQKLPATNVEHVEDGFNIHYDGKDYDFVATEKTPGRIFLVDAQGRKVFKWEMPVTLDEGEHMHLVFNKIGDGGFQPTLCYKNIV